MEMEGVTAEDLNKITAGQPVADIEPAKISPHTNDPHPEPGAMMQFIGEVETQMHRLHIDMEHRLQAVENRIVALEIRLNGIAP